MIQAILTFKFILRELENGDVEPEFQPIQMEFHNEDYSKENFSELISRSGLFSVFYQHTTTSHEITGEYSNSYSGRLKDTPFRVISHFIQLSEESQFLILAIFSLSDETSIFENLTENLATRLKEVFKNYDQAIKANQLSLITNIHKNIRNELKFTIYQIDRLSNLDKLQKIALIFNSESRIKILETLRQYPIAKSEMRDILEGIKENPNIDLLLEPFIELNLIKRDWIKGKRDKRTGITKNQGEYLFLTKDIALVKVPNEGLINHMKEFNEDLYNRYRLESLNYFSKYEPTTQTIEETKELAKILLDPDIYDTFVLMRNKFFPIDKIPKIFSEFASVSSIFDKLKDLNLITEIEDPQGRKWLLLLADIKPLIFFPEYLLPRIRESFHNKKDANVTLEIAKKAFELMEVAYPEKVEF